MMSAEVDTDKLDCKAKRFLASMLNALPRNDHLLLSQIIAEWYRSIAINDILNEWLPYKKANMQSSISFLHILCFNVRGLSARWGEVSLMASTQRFDIMVLGEVGQVDFSLVNLVFQNYRYFYQPGENAHGGVLVIVRNGISTSRVPCSVANVCVVDLMLEEKIRLIGLYAPASKSWRWPDLSPLISKRCCIMGDFNVDIEKDGVAADDLLEWMDSCSLAPYVPHTYTSLRANRTIDYALAKGVDITLQAHEEPTTSDHKPLFCVLACEGKEKMEGSRTIWPVFTAVLSFLFEYWETEWNREAYEETYSQFSAFLALLAARCTVRFPLKHARPAIPLELRKLLAQSRALSIKAKRKGDVLLRQEAQRLRNFVRFELRVFHQRRMEVQLTGRHSTGEASAIFWSQTKRHFRPAASSLRGFMDPGGNVIKDPQEMANMAADHFEQLFEAPVVMRPHPFVDSPPILWENAADPIPMVSYPEVVNVLRTRKKKRSCDAHGLSPFLLNQMPRNYWHLIIRMYNHSFATAYIPMKCKEVRMILLAKKNSLCNPDQTRPISLLDSFLKIQERLFLNRFLVVLKDRGILPDNQSGFRAGHRLQTRVLLLIEQISSYMANSAPVATIFVDFKSAFDQMWFEGCLGKLVRLGIPIAYVNWIRSWLGSRKACIEVLEKRSRWIEIKRGAPQGSCLSPTLFITYHSDMANWIPTAMCFFFADDLAAVLAGRMGIRYTDQCLDLERRLHTFIDQLELYAVLAVQPINYPKTKGMFSARAILYPDPLPVLICGTHQVEWITSFKYLGYVLSTKLGWGRIIGGTRIRTRQRTALVNSVKVCGTTSLALRRALFSTFVLPIYTWLFALYPLFTAIQREELNHSYYTLLKRLYRCQQWGDFLFASLFGERSLDDRCFTYWEKYLKALEKTEDGFLLIEQHALNAHRSEWQTGRKSIMCMYRSKRFVEHPDVLGMALKWMADHGTSDSVVPMADDELRCFAEWPESF